MQTATILLAIGGHQGNTVSKRGITPSEVAVLIAIHGNSAVSEIEPDDVPVSLVEGDNIAKRSDRAERSRLLEIYGKPQNVNGQIVDTSPVSTLFPGAAARMFHDFDELDLDESFFKAATRVKAKPGRGKAAARAEDDDGVEDMGSEQDESGEESAPKAAKPKGGRPKAGDKSMFS